MAAKQKGQLAPVLPRAATAVHVLDGELITVIIAARKLIFNSESIFVLLSLRVNKFQDEFKLCGISTDV